MSGGGCVQSPLLAYGVETWRGTARFERQSESVHGHEGAVPKVALRTPNIGLSLSGVVEGVWLLRWGN